MRRRADRSQRSGRRCDGHRLKPLIENEPDVDGHTSPRDGDAMDARGATMRRVWTQYIQGNAAAEEGS